MKKIFSTRAVATALLTGYGAYNGQSETKLSDIALENVEALASVDVSSNDTWQVGTKTIKRTIQCTNETGWSWNVGANAWFFNGSISHSAPETTWTEEESVTINCCRKQGNLKDCNYEIC